MKGFEIEDIRDNQQIIEEITQLEEKIARQLGRHVALIAYIEEDEVN
jgi:hypothetical protein